MKKLKIVIYVVVTLVLLTFVTAFAMRERILHKIIDKIVQSEKRKHDLNIKINEAKFVGLTSVSFKGISVVPQDRDTLLRVENFKVSVSILPLFLGHIKIDELKTNNAVLNIIHKKGIRNFDFLLKRDTTNIDTTKTDGAGI
ncbi:MAG: AsmA family protein, partial [bacterium]